MSYREIKQKMTELLDSWLEDSSRTDTSPFTFKLGREDSNFLEVEVYFPDPDSDFTGDPEWAMIPVSKAMRPETRFNGSDWEVEMMTEPTLADFGKVLARRAS